MGGLLMCRSGLCPKSLPPSNGSKQRTLWILKPRWIPISSAFGHTPALDTTLLRFQASPTSSTTGHKVPGRLPTSGLCSSQDLATLCWEHLCRTHGLWRLRALARTAGQTDTCCQPIKSRFPLPPVRSSCSPKSKKIGREVVSKQERGSEELAGPHWHIGCPQSDCFIQRYLLVLWGVCRMQLHTTHRESLLPGFFLCTRATAPRSLTCRLQGIGQFSPRGGTLGEPVRGELQFHHTGTQRCLQTQGRQRLWLAPGRMRRSLTPIGRKT